VLNFVPDPARAVEEMARVTRPGGEVALYVWDYAGKMELIRHFWDAAAAFDPRGAELDEGKRFPICEPQALHGLLAAAGRPRRAGDTGHRRVHGVSRLRRLLDAVPGRSRPRTGLLCLVERERPRRLA
jgi:hypothetical protein